MKLNLKMMLLFSAMMLAAVAVLSSYSTQLNIESFADFSDLRFRSISHTVSEALDQQISLMDLVLEELLDNASFMAAVNQFVRDDRDDQKLATAAKNTMLQQLYRSPLVENFYRVSFYTTDGDFVTSRFEKDDYLVSGTPQAQEVIRALPWLPVVNHAPTQRHMLTRHPDFLSVRRDMPVYGVVRAAVYHGNQLGYLEVSNEYSVLESIMDIADQEGVSIQVCFDDGSVLYASAETPLDYPVDMPHRSERGAGEYERFAPVYDPSDALFDHTVRVSDLDMNVHMNNVAYLRLACDAFSVRETERMRIRSFEIIFKAQSFEGDRLTVCRKDEDGRTYVSAFKSDGTRVFDVAFDIDRAA